MGLNSSHSGVRRDSRSPSPTAKAGPTAAKKPKLGATKGSAQDQDKKLKGKQVTVSSGGRKKKVSNEVPMQVERRESGQADSESAMEMEYGRSEDEELEVK